MMCPTVNAMTALRHLAKYLSGVRHQALLLRRTPGGLYVESYSDSDWATNKAHRRSVSAGVIKVGGSLLFSSSRTQRIIALSSGEAELLATASNICDAMLARQCVGFLSRDALPCIVHHLDATAAKGMLERSGVGRVRHLSVRVLWVQSQVESGTIVLKKIATAINPADLGTKSLSRARMRLLLYTLGAYDSLHGVVVGEPEYLELQQKQIVKDAVKAVRGSNLETNKAMIRAVVFAVCSALSHAADPNTEAMPVPEDDVPPWVTRLIVWVIGLWVPDDHGGAILRDLGNSHVFWMVMGGVLLIIFHVVASLFSHFACRGVSVQVVNTSGVHVVLDGGGEQALNVHVNVAPGPSNPRGARSKAKAKPGPRVEMNAEDDNLDDDESDGSETLYEMLGMPTRVARKRAFLEGTVFTSESGRCFHKLQCFKLDECDRIKPHSLASVANSGKYRACKKCNP